METGTTPAVQLATVTLLQVASSINSRIVTQNLGQPAITTTIVAKGTSLVTRTTDNRPTRTALLLVAKKPQLPV